MKLNRFITGIIASVAILALWGCGGSPAEKTAEGETESSSIETITESEIESAASTDIGYMFCVNGSPMEDIRRFLSEKYGITEAFSFYDTGRDEIGYSGEKIEDVTIFGIYPGMNIDAAWAALTGNGFYANPNGEIENCLLADFDSGSVSVSFWTEEDKVTLISVSPYDKTAE